MIFIFLGAVFIFYDFLLLTVNPVTFLDSIFSFTHIWSVLGLYLIFVGIYRKKTGKSFYSCWKKWIKILVTSLGGIVVVIASINLFFILTPKTASINESSDYVILLGGGIDKNGKLSKLVEYRCEKTAEYLKQNENAVCVVSGGKVHWSPFAEAPALKESLVKKGISEDRILVEDQALDTIQNLKYSVYLLSENQGKSVDEILNSKVVVVTTNFHLARAERLAKRLGFKNVKGIASKMTFYKVPNSYAREICAYVKLNLRILITGEPKSLSPN